MGNSNLINYLFDGRENLVEILHLHGHEKLSLYYGDDFGELIKCNGSNG